MNPTNTPTPTKRPEQAGNTAEMNSLLIDNYLEIVIGTLEAIAKENMDLMTDLEISDWAFAIDNLKSDRKDAQKILASLSKMWERA